MSLIGTVHDELIICFNLFILNIIIKRIRNLFFYSFYLSFYTILVFCNPLRKVMREMEILGRIYLFLSVYAQISK